MKKFALIGCGGYIAPRHLDAIKNTGNQLVVAFDVNDSVGILDKDFQDVEFFTDFEEFYNFIQDNPVDYISICTPNYLHKSHIAFGLRNKCDVICEKPLVLEEKDLDDLLKLEKSTGSRVNTILQLRVHESIIELKKRIEASKKDMFDVDLIYLTSRGPWFHRSWKGEMQKSGGLAANIGIHFFDMLVMLFGELKSLEVHHRDDHLVGGYLELERARVRWMLSVDRKYLPQSALDKGMTTFRSITVDGEEIEFSGGFTELHKKVYERTLDGNGFGLEDARIGVRISETIRNSIPQGVGEHSHPMLREIFS